MGLLALALVAVLVGVAAVWMTTRRSAVADRGRRGFDAARSGLALVTCAVAVLAGIDILVDRTMEFPPAGWLLLGAALVAAAIALVPGTDPWSDRRRAVAGGAGALWAAGGIGLWPFAVMVSACACAGAGPSYVPPAPLGIEARGWYVVAVVVGGLSLVVAGSRLPDRLRHAAERAPR